MSSPSPSFGCLTWPPPAACTAVLTSLFSERSLKSEVSSSMLAGGGQVKQPVDGEGLLIGLAISGAGEFFVSLLARNQAPAEAPAAASAAPTPTTV